MPKHTKRQQQAKKTLERASHEVASSKRRRTLLDDDEEEEETWKKGFDAWKANLHARERCKQDPIPRAGATTPASASAAASSGQIQRYPSKSVCIGYITTVEYPPLTHSIVSVSSTDLLEKEKGATVPVTVVKLVKAVGKLRERMGFRIKDTQYLRPMEAFCLLDQQRLKLLCRPFDGSHSELRDEDFYPFQEAYARLLEFVEDFRTCQVYCDLFSRGYTVTESKRQAPSFTLGTLDVYLKKHLQYLVVINDGEKPLPCPQWFARLKNYQENMLLAIVTDNGANIVYLSSNFTKLEELK